MAATGTESFCSVLNAQVPVMITETSARLPSKPTNFNPNGLAATISELQESDWAGMFVCSSELQKTISLRPWNLFKLFIELLTYEKWIWWPFSSPKAVPHGGEARVYWLCICGEERCAEVPQYFADKLQGHLFQHKKAYLKHLQDTISSKDVSNDYLELLQSSSAWTSVPFPKDLSQRLHPHTSLMEAARGILLVKNIARVLHEYVFWKKSLHQIFSTLLISVLLSLVKFQRPNYGVYLQWIVDFSTRFYYLRSRWEQVHEPSTRQYLRVVNMTSFILQGCLLSFYAYRRQTRILDLLRIVAIETASELMFLSALLFNLQGNIIVFLAWAVAERQLLQERTPIYPQNPSSDAKTDPEHRKFETESVKSTAPSSSDVVEDNAWKVGEKVGDSILPSIAGIVSELDTPLQAGTHPSTHQEISHTHAGNQQEASQPSASQAVASQQTSSHPALGAQQASILPPNASIQQNVGIQPVIATAQHSAGSQTPKTTNVFLVVTCGMTHKLAQLLIEQQITTNQFFQQLKCQYLECRGLFRRILSVWRYSHCDFYRFQKFEAKSYELQKEDFPLPANVEYEYAPRPVGSIPPIGPHEFYKRFHACYNSQHQRWLPFRHTFCFRPNAHNRERLACLPKRELSIIEDSDQLEVFWGIYARERPSFAGLLIYNFIFLAPCIVLIFMWLFGWGHAADLQNATMPITVTIGGLSLFWSLFLSSFNSTGR